MKKNFETPEIDILILESEDIMSSSYEPDPDQGSDETPGW